VTQPRTEEQGPERFGELVGRVPAMRDLFAQAARLAEGSESVLLCGEAGTGKDLLARSLHVGGPRRTAPFIAVDCAGVEPSALAGELFGKGSRAGALELARGGTLLLDEVTSLPLSLQPRLSEAIRTRSFVTDMGRQLTLDVRVIAASKRRPSDEREREKFLPALFEQLAPHVLTLPPLRDRRDDLALLARTLLARLNEGAGLSLTPDAVAAFALHDWPGNVRELRNVIERALHGLRTGGPGARHLAALWFGFEEGPAADDPDRFEPGLSYREQRARFEHAFEKRYVAWLLDRHDGNVSAAARAADMDRKYLYKLARKHALKSSP
jgi:DNA-binding NtrC family response regulator